MIRKKLVPVSLGALFFLGLGAAIFSPGLEALAFPEERGYPQLKGEASMGMQKAFEEIKRAKVQRGIPIEEDDINSTGMIGPEFSPLVTTLGVLSAKRTATNPNFAGLIAEMFLRAGVRGGDFAAFGLSGSFPSLNIACLAAAGVLKLNPIVISSVGSSKWGATHPQMTWLDMEDILYKKGLIPAKSIAASLSGGTIRDFLIPEGRDLARAAVERNHVRLIDAPDLSAHIQKRLELYEEHSRPKSVRVFVNVGGPLVNMGTAQSRREIPTGLNRQPLLANSGRHEGIIRIMLQRGIPVIHLLNINNLAKRYGLPIDPVPLPQPLARNY